MMRRLVSLSALLALAGAGCQSVSTRARQHAEVFQSLAPAVQARLLTGEVRTGDTPAMVEIAFGTPDDDKSLSTSNGRIRRSWVYTEKQYIKEGSQLLRVDERRHSAEVADVYRVVHVLVREVTFLDDLVVQVRDPRREAQALAALK